MFSTYKAATIEPLNIFEPSVKRHMKLLNEKFLNSKYFYCTSKLVKFSVQFSFQFFEDFQSDYLYRL